MANYIFSYDLNGQRPTHEEMDKHIEASEWSCGRILETVWYIGTSDEANEVSAFLTSILSANDSYTLVKAEFMVFQNLLVRERDIQTSWMKHT